MRNIRYLDKLIDEFARGKFFVERVYIAVSGGHYLT